jgi:hypothetical protein
MGWRARLHDLDRRSGFAQTQLNAVEFAAPFNLVATFFFAGFALWLLVRGEAAPAAMFSVFTLFSSLVTVAGFRRRRRRNANEDKWQPL